jgi:putative peptide zinc metalloprotease protein
VVAFIAIPLHELSHALVAYVCGVPVVEIGLTIGRLPRPYVYTPNALEHSRRVRFAIAAAGPACDWLLAAVAAALAYFGIAGEASRFAFACLLVLAVLGSSPAREGDGSHMLEALLDDELSRRAAFSGRRSHLSSPRTIRRYRLATLAHSVAALALVVYLER